MIPLCDDLTRHLPWNRAETTYPRCRARSVAAGVTADVELTRHPAPSPRSVEAATAAGADAGRSTVVLRGGLWSAASQILPAAGTAVLSVAAGRYLGSGALGQQSLIAYLNAAMSAVLVISLNTALLQIGGRLQGEGAEAQVRRLVRWAVGAHLLAGLGVLATMIGLGALTGDNHAAWLIIGVVTVLDALADALAVRLVLTEGWAPIGRLRLVFQLLGAPLGLVFLFAGLGIAGIFLGDGLAALGLLVFALRRYRRLGPVGGTRSVLRPPVPVLRTFALFALSAVITQIVTKRVEFVVLAVFANSSAIGQYSVAFMAVSLIAMLPLGVATAAMPAVARAEGSGQMERAVHHLRFALRVGTAVSIPAVGLLAALGPAAVLAVYGTGYRTAAHLVAIAALSLLVAVITGVCSQFWAGRGRLAVVLGTGALAGAVDIGTAVALVPGLSALGAVLANLVAQIVLAAGLLLATVRRTGAIGWRTEGLVRMVIIGAGGAFAAALTRIGLDRLPVSAEPRAAIGLVVGTFVGVGVVVLAARVLRPLDRAEADWLRSLLPARLRPAVDRVAA